MFKKARIKLTAQYLVIIMAISIFFSLIIYSGATAELNRIQTAQRLKRPGVGVFAIDPEVLEDSKNRISASLLILNLAILGISAASGYYLAGKTLRPIEKMVEEQKNFVANASHQLKTPLTALKSEIEVNLRNKKIKLSDAKKLLVSNLEEVNKINTLSNYLLRLDKLQNGKKKLFKKVDLSKVIREAVTKVKPIAKAKNISIKNNVSKKYIKGDKESLVELAVVLLDNSIKYSKSRSKIEVNGTRNGFVVKDYGKGIDKKDLPHIFEKFYGDGSGLGLSIAKEIAKMHRATIKVESNLEKGSTFKVIFS